VLSIPSREEMFEKCDWAGGYLYLRWHPSQTLLNY
jgi:hypothetical protein